jgi:spore germination protein GerM
MAVRKTGTRRTKKKSPLKPASKRMGNRMPVSAAFRIFLLIVIIIAFFMLFPKIKNLRLNPKTAETEQQQEQPEDREQGTGEDERKAREEGTGKREQGTEGKKPQTEKPVTPAQPSTALEQKEPENKPQGEKPAAPAPVSTPPVKPAETRDRSIYLIQAANMTPVKVNRKLNVSDTPLKDSINALLAGPTADERRRDMESLVPEGSKLLSARVEGSTAYLDFNQEFRYNTRGSEGCAAQIKQIVWTATEFSNVQNVQFLIEGQKVNFLSEGVVISNPIGR